MTQTDPLQRGLTGADLSHLEEIARRIRIESLKMVAGAHSGHPGGPLGMADVMAYLFDRFLRLDPQNPGWDKRDRFILSNGHTCAGYYAALALEGFLPVEELATFRKLGSRLQGHPSPLYLPFLENAGGSLGQGLSFAVGSALAARVRHESWRVVAAISDGECEEGMTWEAAMAAAHYKLDNLIAWVDRNNIQIDGKTDKVMSVEPFLDKWLAFGWAVMEADGHDFQQIDLAFRWADGIRGRPAVIVFRTVLGKGVSFMENDPGWHGKAPSEEQLAQALAELGGGDS